MIQPFDVKMAREALCVAQTDVGSNTERSHDDRIRVIMRLQQLIDLMDMLRPLGPAGTHDDRHTPFCGCDR